MTKKQLQQKNADLKQAIKELQETIIKLETKISSLQLANTFGHRGLPWRR